MERVLVRGFTLIELLISISIIGIISALVLVRFSSFDSSVLLKSAAYEVALALRDAQVYSVSVHGDTGQFDYPYGVHFVANGNTYTFFKYMNTNMATTPRYVTTNPHNAQAVTTFTIGRSIIISNICITTTSGETCGTATPLDISFRRPEFTALFYSGGTSGIISTKIKLQAPSGSEVWVVEVGLLGHISVYKQ